jgi:hypothetical protein
VVIFHFACSLQGYVRLFQHCSFKFGMLKRELVVYARP